MHVSANTVFTNAWNLLPKWSSTPQHRRIKKRYKKSNGARKYAYNLRANKKLCFNERNFKSGQHNSMKKKFQDFAKLPFIVKHIRRLVLVTRKQKQDHLL